MDYKFTYFGNNGEAELINIDYSGVTFKTEIEEKTKLYRSSLEGEIVVWGVDFDNLYSFLQSGTVSVFGEFYVGGVKKFVSQNAYGGSISYILDSNTLDLESKILKIKVEAYDVYYHLYDNWENKENIFSMSGQRYNLKTKKERKYLTFYTTQVEESTIYFDGLGLLVYAREEIKDPTANEVATLNGNDGWVLISGNILVRDWTENFRPPVYEDDIKLFDFGQSMYWDLNIQLNFDERELAPPPYFLIAADNVQVYGYSPPLEGYTILSRPISEGSVPASRLFCLRNDVYYGSEIDNDLKTIQNALKLEDVVNYLFRNIYPDISFIDYLWEKIYTRDSGASFICLQLQTELAQAKSIALIGSGFGSTIGYLSLFDLMAMLRDRFNTYFYYHPYFNEITIKTYDMLCDSYLTIDLTNHAIGDLTPVHEIEYNNADKFSIISRGTEGETSDFIGVDIKFPNVIKTKKEDKKYTNYKFDTSYVVNYQDKFNTLDNETWMVAERGSDSYIVQGNTILNNKFATYPNNNLSVASIDEKLVIGSDRYAVVNNTTKTLDVSPTLPQVFNYATLILFEIPQSLGFEIVAESYFKTQYSNYHKLKTLTIKLDGSPAEIVLYM